MAGDQNLNTLLQMLATHGVSTVDPTNYPAMQGVLQGIAQQALPADVKGADAASYGLSIPGAAGLASVGKFNDEQTRALYNMLIQQFRAMRPF